MVHLEPRRARSRSPGVSTWSTGPSLGPRPRSSSVSSRYQMQEGTGVSEPVVRPGSPIVSESGQSTRHLSRSYRLGKEASHERLRALAAARPKLDLPPVVMATSTPLVGPRGSGATTIAAGPRVATATPQHSGAIRVSDLPMREDEIDTLLYGRSTAANQTTGVSHASQSADLSPDKASVTADGKLLYFLSSLLGLLSWKKGRENIKPIVNLFLLLSVVVAAAVRRLGSGILKTLLRFFPAIGHFCDGLSVFMRVVV